VVSLGDTGGQEIMGPRVDMVGIEAEASWSETLDRIRSSEHARLPVFRETIDDIVGILYAKDVLPVIVADEEPTNGWGSLVRRATFIPVSKRIDAQLREFSRARTSPSSATSTAERRGSSRSRHPRGDRRRDPGRVRRRGADRAAGADRSG
jgi:Mg2+/Co2+ transporter CorC